jgi:hypothetical protein
MGEPTLRVIAHELLTSIKNTVRGLDAPRGNACPECGFWLSACFANTAIPPTCKTWRCAMSCRSKRRRQVGEALRFASNPYVLSGRGGSYFCGYSKATIRARARSCGLLLRIPLTSGEL